MSARIVVTLVCEYEGEDVPEYDAAMALAAEYVRDAGDDLALAYEGVRVLDVTVTG